MDLPWAWSLIHLIFSHSGSFTTTLTNSVPRAISSPWPCGFLQDPPLIILQGISSCRTNRTAEFQVLNLWWLLFWPKSQDITDHQVGIYCLNKMDKMFKTRQFLRVQDIWLLFLSQRRGKKQVCKLKAFLVSTQIKPFHRNCFLFCFSLLSTPFPAPLLPPATLPHLTWERHWRF